MDVQFTQGICQIVYTVNAPLCANPLKYWPAFEACARSLGILGISNCMRYTSEAYPINGSSPAAPKGQTMSQLRHAVAMPTEETSRAAEIVEALPGGVDGAGPGDGGALHLTELKITFTGGRKYGHPRRDRSLQRRALQVGEEEDGAQRRGGGQRRDHRLQPGHALWRMAGRHAVRGQPLRRPLRRARRQNSADGRVERQRRAAADACTASRPDRGVQRLRIEARRAAVRGPCA